MNSMYAVNVIDTLFEKKKRIGLTIGFRGEPETDQSVQGEGRITDPRRSVK